MSDLAKWKVHGPVGTLRTEFATWDLNQEDWQPVQHFTVTSFRPDGTISTSDTHNPDGSIAHSRWLYNDAGRLTESNSCLNDGPIGRAVYFYDEAGRHVRTAQLSHDGTQTDSEICTYDAQSKRTKVRLLGLGGANTAYGIEGTDMALAAPGATMMTITYDEKDLATKVLFHDANHNLLRYVIFMRDSAGNLLNVEMHVGGESLFQDLANKVPSEGREGMAVMLKQAFGEAFSSTTYVYDTQAGLSNGRMEWVTLVETARSINMMITMIPSRKPRNIEVARRALMRMGSCTTL
jgi:hypothetical protein